LQLAANALENEGNLLTEPYMGEQPKILIIQTSGVSTPERIPAGFFIATTAAAMNMDATIIFTVNGGTIVERQAAEKTAIKDGGATIRSFLDQAVSAGVKLVVCHQSLDLHDLEPDNLIDEVEEIIGAAALLDMTLESDIVLTF
jgi:predicted peroxiredoxin